MAGEQGRCARLTAPRSYSELRQALPQGNREPGRDRQAQAEEARRHILCVHGRTPRPLRATVPTRHHPLPRIGLANREGGRDPVGREERIAPRPGQFSSLLRHRGEHERWPAALHRGRRLTWQGRVEAGSRVRGRTEPGEDQRLRQRRRQACSPAPDGLGRRHRPAGRRAPLAHARVGQGHHLRQDPLTPLTAARVARAARLGGRSVVPVVQF